MSAMSTRKTLRRSSFLVTVAVLASLSVLVILATRRPGSATALPGGQASGAMAGAIAQKTEKLHVVQAQAVAEENEASLPSPASQPQVSPERAIQLMQLDVRV